MQKDSVEEVEVTGERATVSYLMHLLKLLLVLMLNIMYWLLTNPVSGGPKVVVGALFLLFLLAYQLFLLGLTALSAATGVGASVPKRKVFAVMISIGCVVAVGLKSLDQLGIADVALITLTEFVAGFYIARRF